MSEGYRPLRDWIAVKMAKTGVTCRTQNILITSGSRQVRDDLGRLMISPGHDRLDPLANRDAASFAVKARAAYSAHRDQRLAALARHMPDTVAWTRPKGGMFVWLTQPPCILTPQPCWRVR